MRWNKFAKHVKCVIFAFHLYFVFIFFYTQKNNNNEKKWQWKKQTHAFKMLLRLLWFDFAQPSGANQASFGNDWRSWHTETEQINQYCYITLRHKAVCLNEFDRKNKKKAYVNRKRARKQRCDENKMIFDDIVVRSAHSKISHSIFFMYIYNNTNARTHTVYNTHF